MKKNQKPSLNPAEKAMLISVNCSIRIIMFSLTITKNSLRDFFFYVCGTQSGRRGYGGLPLTVQLEKALPVVEAEVSIGVGRGRQCGVWEAQSDHSILSHPLPPSPSLPARQLC